MTTKARKSKKTSKVAPDPADSSAGAGRYKKGHRPHNAKPADPVSSIEEVIHKIGREPRQVMKNGEMQVMSRTERLFRTWIEAALKKQVRPLARLLKLMIKYPQLLSGSRPSDTTIYINGHLANV